MVCVVMMSAADVLLVLIGGKVARAMLMEVKGAEEKEHGEKADHEGPGDFIEAGWSEFHGGMGEQVEDGDAEHQATNEADDNLDAGMGEVDDGGEPTTNDGCQENCPRVSQQQPEAGWIKDTEMRGVFHDDRSSAFREAKPHILTRLPLFAQSE